jgi:hypothetical protein
LKHIEAKAVMVAMVRHTQDLENEAKYGYTKFVAS